MRVWKGGGGGRVRIRVRGMVRVMIVGVDVRAVCVWMKVHVNTKYMACLSPAMGRAASSPSRATKFVTLPFSTKMNSVPAFSAEEFCALTTLYLC